ncbi:MAG: hypothetical protein ACRCZO_20000 [Cetobacterium sp.]
MYGYGGEQEEVEEAKTEMFLMEIRATVVDHVLSHDLKAELGQKSQMMGDVFVEQV